MAAESVSDVLELARLRQQSGLLSIERSQGGRVEEGEIYFQDGQPQSTRVGQLSGQEALTQLLTWRQIHFVFIPDVPRPQGDQDRRKAPPQPSSHPLPLDFAGSRIPQMGFDRPPGYANTFQNSSYTSARFYGNLVPQKRGVEREVLLMPLTRPQRFIYFLVDGHRTLTDLARCTGKNIQEVEWVLSELQEQGLVAL